MKLKILIIGKKSFIATNLKKYFKSKKIYFKDVGFTRFLKNKKFFTKRFNLVINCSSNKSFVNKKYLLKNDYDTRIANIIRKFKIKLIIISTRKVYQPRYNLKENYKTSPKCNYSRNKLKAEKISSKLLGDKLLVLRVSNIIGLPVKNPRKLHKTFIDIFYENACKGIVYENYNSYKDFISVNQFSKIIISLVKFKAYGIYNVSLGKKVYLNNIVNWLNFYNSRNVVRIDSINSFNNDNFTLNNKKLKNKINFDNSLLTLKKECLSLSKQIFKT